MAIYYLRQEETIKLTSSDEPKKVLLAPSLYWYAYAEFPTRSLAKARRLADAFLDSRPREYRDLYVQRRGNGYDCFAYDAEALRMRLKTEGLEKADRYFLQQFREWIPRRVDDETIVDAIKDVCLEIPDRHAELPSLATLPFDNVLPFSSNSGDSGHKRLLTTFTILLTITMLLDLGLRLQRQYAFQNAFERIKTERSIYEIRALSKKYEKIAKKQMKLRNEITRSLQNRLKKLSCTPEEGCRHE